MKLRPYQQAAVDAATAWMSKSLHPAALELATGAGKSLICAAIGRWLEERADGKVLCLAPTRELVEQNASKYRTMYGPCSIYSASIEKSIRYDMVYGTPQSVVNALHLFDGQFKGVIVDECGETTPTIRKVISHIRTHNPRLRVVGMTATPYTMMGGYIYEVDDNDMVVIQAHEPYYKKLIYRVTTPFLIEQGYLTCPNLDPSPVEYDTSGLKLASTGSFTGESVRAAFEGHRELTSGIVTDILAHSVDRMGVMIFAATVQHAKEVLEMLPPDDADMIGGDVNMGVERPEVTTDFKEGRIKYLVSVGTLTRGFDATHVDVIAVLRGTESPALFQQIIGRGLRLHEGKDDVLILDYGGNIERHGLEDDLFSPEIRARKSDKEAALIDAECELCHHTNEFAARENEGGFKIDKNGYFITLLGERVKTDDKDMPAHYGRRCGHVDLIAGELVRCEYRWSFKLCPECDGENDIAARYCEHCKHELVDPEKKLEREFKRMKKDPRALTTDYVAGWRVQRWTTSKGDDAVRIDFSTAYRTVSQWYLPKYKTRWAAICDAVFGADGIASDVPDFLARYAEGKMPRTITSQKRENGFYNVSAFNLPADEERILDKNNSH